MAAGAAGEPQAVRASVKTINIQKTFFIGRDLQLYFAGE
jgi:hypothetical protein